MTIKGRKTQGLSMIYIPEAALPVRRLRLPRRKFYIIAAIICLLAAALVTWQYIMHTQSSQQIDYLSEQLMLEQESYSYNLANKNETIDYLHEEILLLSQQTEKVKIQIDQLKTLESKLIDMISEPIISDHPPSASPGIGGQYIKPTDRQITSLIQETELSLLLFRDELHKLSESLSKAKIVLDEREIAMQKIPSIWPTKSRLISSRFGIRKDPFSRSISFHGGIDIAGYSSDPIVSSADGIIKSTGWDASKGGFIVVDHTNGLHSIYMHLSKILISKGENIKKGEIIGSMGSTGRSTGPHLHYEIHKNGVQINPLDYIP